MDNEKNNKYYKDIGDLNKFSSIYNEQDEIIYLRSDEVTGFKTYIKQFNNNSDNSQIKEVVEFYRHYDLLDISEKANIVKIDLSEDITTVVFSGIEGELLSDKALLNSLSSLQAIYIAQMLIKYIQKNHRLFYRSYTLRPDHIFFDSKNNNVTIVPVLSRSIKKLDKKFITNKYQCLYLSPEELDGETQFIDWRSDYYKIGIIFYELISKRKILDLVSKDIESIIYFHLNKKNIFFENENNYQNEMLNHILYRLIKVDANLRYCSEKEILQDLLYLESCINKQDEKKISLIQHRINSYIYPRKFYNNSFDKINQLKNNGLTNIIVSGYSGYGKSEFINLIGMKCVSSNIIFLIGKFEQYDTNSAYMAIKQALSGLKTAYNLISLKDKLYEFKKSVPENIFNSIRLLCQGVFECYEVYGSDKSEDVLNNKNMFYRYVFLLFEKLTEGEQHIFISFDDIQWCDKESKDLIMYMIERKSKWLHFILSYRINEIDENKYAKSMIDICSEDELSYEEKIYGFSDEECNDYINNFIGLSSSKGFCIDINRRSQGAPFFIKQILTSLEIEKNASPTEILFSSKNEKIVDEYKSLEFYIQRNLDNLDVNVLEILKYLSCYSKPLEVEVIEEVFKLSKNDAFLNLNIDKYFEYIRNASNGLSITHDKIKQTVYESISPQQRSEIHKNIAYALLRLKKHGCIPDAAIQLNLSKHILSDDELKDAFKLNVEAGRYSLSQFSYDTSNMFYGNALDFISDHEGLFDARLKEELLYGHVYTAYLSGMSVNAFGDIESLLDYSNNIVEASKYYALFKDIIVNSNLNYTKATEKGVELLSKFNINIPDNFYDIEKLISSVNSSDAVSICSNKLIGMKKGDDIEFEEKYHMRILLDLWEASYYSRNNEIMAASIYKIVDLTVKNNICSESSFGFALYAMYLSKNSQYVSAYHSGLLALSIVAVFEDDVMYPKITNLFCNYSAFYTESFSAVSKRYYSSYQASIRTSDFLFGAWAVYFHLWTKLLSGDILDDVLERASEMFQFLDKTNDKKMILSFFILYDSVSSLVGNGIDFIDSNKSFYFNDVDDDFSFFYKLNFPQGGAWKSILNCMNNYLFGNYFDVIESVDKYISEHNIDNVMFPLTQIYFFESLSIIKILSANELNKSKENDLRDKLNESVRCLTELSVNGSTNFNSQYSIVQLALLFNDASLDKSNIAQLIQVVHEFGNCMEKGVLYELLAQHEITKKNIKVASEYLFKSIHEFESWGAITKKKQLQYVYSSILNDSSINVIDNSNFQDVSCDLTKLINATKSISSYIEADVFICSLVDVVAKNSLANRVSFISYFDRKYKVCCNHINGDTRLISASKLKYGSKFVYSDLVQYCYDTKTSILLNESCSDVPFMNSSYVLNNDVKSLICMPIIGYDRILAVMYLESSIGGVDFSKETLCFVKELMSQMTIHFINAIKFDQLNSKSIENNNVIVKLKNQLELMDFGYKYSNSGMWQWDIITGKLDWSDEVFNIFGFSKTKTEINYNNFLMTIFPDDRVRVEGAIQQCLGGAEYDLEYRIIRPDGSIRWLSVNGNVIRDNNSIPIQMFGVVQDITLNKEVDQANKELSEQLNQAQKMESIGNLTGGIAHDFNNILASMLGYTELTQARVSSISDIKVIEYLDNIYIAGQRAKDLVAQMSLFSRTHKLKKEPVSLTPIVKESLKLLTSTMPSGIKITSLIDEDIPDVIMDPIQAQQILINLCVNSRDAIGDLGSISISLHESYLSAKCDACHEAFHGDLVILSVEDDGSGIDPLILTKIFDPFFTTKEVGKGTGMGMSVVHGIVHSYNGHILVHSSVHGTKISILLPAADKEQNLASVSEYPMFKNVTIKANIVIVDDEELILQYTKELLGLRGAMVTTFNRGADALNFILTHRNEVDLLITDMTMPDMSGSTLSTTLLKEIPEIPIIICSGYSIATDNVVSKQAGIRKYLIKPVDSSELVQTVSEILGVTG
jgi:PAS domain S-box-containing protein